jgi:hypothetical protein
VRTRRRQQGSVSHHERLQFLTALGRGSSVENAARLSGRSRARFYELRQRDHGFADDWARAVGSTPTMFVGEIPEEQPAPLDDIDSKVAALMRTGFYTKAQEPLLYHQLGGAMSDAEWERAQERERRRELDRPEMSKREPGKPRYCDPNYNDAY